MNIHIVTHEQTDHTITGITEGWLLDGMTEKHAIRVSTPRTYLEPVADFWESMPSTDAVILTVQSGPYCRNIPRAVQILSNHNLWRKTLLLDNHDEGVDWPYEDVLAKVARCLFFRHILYERFKAMPNVEWFPSYGIEQRVLRYAGALPWRYWKDVPVVSLYRTDHPQQKHRERWQRKIAEVVPGAIVGQRTGIDGIQSVHRKAHGYRHSTEYFEIVSRARIAVHLLGGNTGMGYQFFQYAALRCAILAMHPLLHPTPAETRLEWEFLDPPVVQDEDYLCFETEKQLEDKLRMMDRDPAFCEELSRRVWEKTKHHNTVERGRYILSILQGFQK